MIVGGDRMSERGERIGVNGALCERMSEPLGEEAA